MGQRWRDDASKVGAGGTVEHAPRYEVISSRMAVIQPVPYLASSLVM